MSLVSFFSFYFTIDNFKSYKILALKRINNFYIRFYSDILAFNFRILVKFVFCFLAEFYKVAKSSRVSFENQLDFLKKMIKSEINVETFAEAYLKLDEVFSCGNMGLTDTIKFLFCEWHKKILNNHDFFDIINQLNLLLNIDFENN